MKRAGRKKLNKALAEGKVKKIKLWQEEKGSVGRRKQKNKRSIGRGKKTK